MTAHKHAALMLQYAQDAAETDKPWQRWEYTSNVSSQNWTSSASHPEWCKHNEYRRKPQTIKIGDIEVPKPITEMPKGEQAETVWVVDIALPKAFTVVTGFVEPGHVHQTLIKRGLCHTTKEAALQHAKALIAISGGETC